MVAVETPEYLNTDENLDELTANEMLDALENKENRVKVWENISDVLQKKSNVREKLEKASETVIGEIDEEMKNDLLDLVWAEGKTQRGKQYFKSNPTKTITAEHRSYMGVLCLYDQLMFHEINPPKTKGRGYMEDAQYWLKKGVDADIVDLKETNEVDTQEQKEESEESNDNPVIDDFSGIGVITPENEPVSSVSDDATVDDFSVVQPIESTGGKKQESNMKDQEAQKEETKKSLDEDQEKVNDEHEVQNIQDEVKEKDKKEQLTEEKKVETVVQPLEVLTTEKHITVTEVNSSYSLANTNGKDELIKEVSRSLGIQNIVEGVHYVVRKEKTSKDESGGYVHTIEATVIPLEKNRVISESPDNTSSGEHTVDASTEITQEEQKAITGAVTEKKVDTTIDESSGDGIVPDSKETGGLDEMLTLEEKEKGLASYRNLLIIKFNVQKEKVDEDMPEKKMRLGYSVGKIEHFEANSGQKGVRLPLKDENGTVMHIGLYTQGDNAGMFYLGLDDKVFSIQDKNVMYSDSDTFNKSLDSMFASKEKFEALLKLYNPVSTNNISAKETTDSVKESADENKTTFVDETIDNLYIGLGEDGLQSLNTLLTSLPNKDKLLKALRHEDTLATVTELLAIENTSTQKELLGLLFSLNLSNSLSGITMGSLVEELVAVPDSNLQKQLVALLFLGDTYSAMLRIGMKEDSQYSTNKIIDKNKLDQNFLDNIIERKNRVHYVWYDIFSQADPLSNEFGQKGLIPADVKSAYLMFADTHIRTQVDQKFSFETIPSRTIDAQRKPYAIISKTDGHIYLFDASHTLVSRKSVLLGKDQSDEPFTVTNDEIINKTIPARTPRGLYEIEARGPKDKIGNYMQLYPKDGQIDYGDLNKNGDRKWTIGIHELYQNEYSKRNTAIQSGNVNDKFLSNGCLNMHDDYYAEVWDHLEIGSMVYVS